MIILVMIGYDLYNDPQSQFGKLWHGDSSSIELEQFITLELYRSDTCYLLR